MNTAEPFKESVSEEVPADVVGEVIPVTVAEEKKFCILI